MAEENIGSEDNEFEEMIEKGILIDVDLDNISITAPTNSVKGLSEEQKYNLSKLIISVINQSLHNLQLQ